MATIMTKQGRLDNVVTYEHICDTKADMNQIDPHYITLGSVCTVINGESDNLEIYIATSEKEWVLISEASGGGGGEVITDLVYICSQDEYDPVTKIPTIQNPESNKFYLVPSNNGDHDLFVEWVWIEDEEKWEQFGGAAIDLTNYATKQELNDKVDKIFGKGLSTNDYTTEEKNKLAGIEIGAQVNVNPNWSDVQNKPTTIAGYNINNAYTKNEINNLLNNKVDKVTGKGLSTNDFTDELKTKLENAQEELTFDELPIEGSNNPVKSNGIALAIMNNIDNLLPSILNAENYVPLMKFWFHQNGSESLSDYSSLCDRWYTITRSGWTGGTRFYHSTTSMASEGTKVGDNADMIAEPSTDTIAGRDDYQSIPLFHCIDCNWLLDENGKPHVTAINGVCGNFERTNPDKLVGVIQMTGWCKRVEDIENDTYTLMYTDVIGASGYYPLPEAVDLDGTVRSWVVHAKYASGADYKCYSGVAPWTYTASYYSAIAAFHTALGDQYGGKTSADDAFLKLMFFLKYASLTADGVLQGCVSYNFQYAVAVQETGVERVILTAAQAANIKVGSTVMVGNPTAFSGANLNIERGQAGMRAKVDRKKVTRKETLTGGNVAVYIDNGGVTFNTTSNTISTTGDSPTYVSTSQWFTGSCDSVRGVDGSPSTPGNGTEPYILQGIECALGATELVSDSIVRYYKDTDDIYRISIHVCRDASKYATSITANYNLVGYALDYLASSGWHYIAELGFDANNPDVWFPCVVGCTSSQRMKDAINTRDLTETTSEWLSVSNLTVSATNGGLSSVSAATGLGIATWNITTRVSATGNRGIYNGGGN